MNYFLTEEQKALVQQAAEFARKEFLPISLQCDENESFPPELVKKLGEKGLFRVLIPREYEGVSGSVLDLCLVVEELSRIDGGLALLIAVVGLGTLPIILFGNEEQKRKYLPAIASGEKLAAFALTEADAGSDVSAIRTKAEKAGDGYLINGAKQWISNGGIADLYTVFANTDPKRGARGLSAFIVEKGTEGFDFGKKENKMGIRANPTRELIFNDVKVPVENMLGREGAGFMVAMKTFDHSRPGVAAQALGIGQGAFDMAMKYITNQRNNSTGNKETQGTDFLIAEIGTKLEAARTLVYQTARTIDSGQRDVSKVAAMAKLYASDIAMEVTIDAIQLMGDAGYIKENLVEKMMRDAKITQIYEGTNQIQKEIVAMKIFKHYRQLG